MSWETPKIARPLEGFGNPFTWFLGITEYTCQTVGSACFAELLRLFPGIQKLTRTLQPASVTIGRILTLRVAMRPKMAEI